MVYSIISIKITLISFITCEFLNIFSKLLMESNYEHLFTTQALRFKFITVVAKLIS